MKRKENREEGLLSLEASITLTIFMFLMFFLYSFFVVFEARNEMAHVLLSTADSLSLDVYANEELQTARVVSQFLVGETIRQLYKYKSEENSDSDFVNGNMWHNSTSMSDSNGNTVIDGEFEEIIEMRFIAFLTAGDPDKAEEILKRYHVKDGRAGLDFSASRVEDDKLYLSVKYTLEYEFHVFNGGEETFEQSVCSKLWK